MASEIPVLLLKTLHVKACDFSWGGMKTKAISRLFSPTPASVVTLQCKFLTVFVCYRYMPSE